VVVRLRAQRLWDLSAGQGIDLIVRSRWRASISADIVLDHAEERYEQTSLVYSAPPRIGTYSSNRKETVAAAAATADVKFFVVPRVFLTAEARVRHYFSQGPRAIAVKRESWIRSWLWRQVAQSNVAGGIDPEVGSPYDHRGATLGRRPGSGGVTTARLAD
jgi:hypothetical protein